MQKFKIAYFYPNQLNLYGDSGNIEVLYYRTKERGFEVAVDLIDMTSSLTTSLLNSYDFIFMGGGPDSGQKEILTDLINNKGPYIKDYIENNGCALFICGSYQLCGNYYKASDGTVLNGLGVFNMYTEHFGASKPRCIGNVVCSFDESIDKDPFKQVLGSFVSKPHLVGFENHGGRTYLGADVSALGRIIHGHGNNSEDKSEGVSYKNSYGTYFHGPVLALNPHFADFLIAKALKILELPVLPDKLAEYAHNARL